MFVAPITAILEAAVLRSVLRRQSYLCSPGGSDLSTRSSTQRTLFSVEFARCLPVCVVLKGVYEWR